MIWHELGRVKEPNGNTRRDWGYSIISICKPLILLWGQTLAFDSRVRANIPNQYNILMGHRSPLTTWKEVMIRFQEDLKQNPKIVDCFKEESLKRFGNNSIVPYGRFLDIYYFEGR